MILEKRLGHITKVPLAEQPQKVEMGRVVHARVLTNMADSPPLSPPVDAQNGLSGPRRRKSMQFITSNNTGQVPQPDAPGR